MNDSYGGWSDKGVFDDTFCMRPSNDTFLGEKVGLQTLGVVDLDTSIMPDVFGLREFDRSKPVVWVLPGDFSNTIRMLMPDVSATPVAFHDILIEDLKRTPEFRTKLMASRDLTSLRRTLAVLAVCGHASASGRDGYNSLIVSGVVVEPGFSCTVDHTYHSRCPVTLRITLGTGAALAVMHSLEWDRQRLCGSPAPLTRHGCVGKVQDRGEVFYPMDGETRNLVQSVVFRRIRHSDGCYAIP